MKQIKLHPIFNRIFQDIPSPPYEPPSPPPQPIGPIQPQDPFYQTAFVEASLSRHPLIFGCITIYDAICSR